MTSGSLQSAVRAVAERDARPRWSICLRDSGRRGPAAATTPAETLSTASVGKLLLLVEVARRCADSAEFGRRDVGAQRDRSGRGLRPVAASERRTALGQGPGRPGGQRQRQPRHQHPARGGRAGGGRRAGRRLGLRVDQPCSTASGTSAGRNTRPTLSRGDAQELSRLMTEIASGTLVSAAVSSQLRRLALARAWTSRWSRPPSGRPPRAQARRPGNGACSTRPAATGASARTPARSPDRTGSWPTPSSPTGSGDGGRWRRVLDVVLDGMRAARARSGRVSTSRSVTSVGWEPMSLTRPVRDRKPAGKDTLTVTASCRPEGKALYASHSNPGTDVRAGGATGSGGLRRIELRQVRRARDPAGRAADGRGELRQLQDHQQDGQHQAHAGQGGDADRRDHAAGPGLVERHHAAVDQGAATSTAWPPSSPTWPA